LISSYLCNEKVTWVFRHTEISKLRNWGRLWK